ncbi:serine hydrolase [Flavitalea flava]
MRTKDFAGLLLIPGLLAGCRPAGKASATGSSSGKTITEQKSAAGTVSPDPVNPYGTTTALKPGADTGKPGIKGGLPAARPVISPTAKTDPFLEQLLFRYPQYFSNILNNKDSFRVQIIYTRIDRDATNTPFFRDYYYNTDPNLYFYPASTVKLPVALLALQRLNELRLPGLDRNASLITGQAYSGQTPVFNDPTTKDGRPTVAQYVKKIFLVSDNDAFNRLYELLGQENLNEKLHKMGYPDAAILHRLEVSMTEDQNRHTNPVSFLDSSGKSIYRQPMQISNLSYPERKDSLGRAYYDKTGMVNHAMDFSKKNRITLESLHRILRSILFPRSVPDSQAFHLREEDYSFVYQFLSEYPGESGYPSYDSAGFPDAYGKFLYWGAEKGRLPRNIRIFSKEGDAYGFLTDISYFADFDKHIEYMLSATIYCNSDGILNDNQYDYERIGLPFLKNLGRVIYENELHRSKARIPDLSGWKMYYQ